MDDATREGAKGASGTSISAGRRIGDAAKLERVEQLAIPPAWKDVWISPSPRAKLQATGYDKAGRKQYLYHPAFRAAQEQAKYDKLISFAEKLPALRATMAEHLDKDALDRERVSAIALRLINLGWFRVGSERYAKESGTYGITTLTRRQSRCAAAAFGSLSRQARRFRCARSSSMTSSRPRCASSGGRGRARVFRVRVGGRALQPDEQAAERLREALPGPDFTAKDFRTWGGTLLAAVAFAEQRSGTGFRRRPTDEKRSVAAVMRRVAQQLGNTPAVCRASYVSPAVVDQYLEGRTLEDFRPRHLRVVAPASSA